MNDFIVVREHPDMLLYIDQLQKKNAEALSFYPRQVFEREKENGRLFLSLLNGQPCGYIYVGAPEGDLKCHQVCIEYEARRRMYGAMLVVVMEDFAKANYCHTITLRCGFDLEANEFWKSLGYGVVAHRTGGIRRQRTINVWKKQLEARLFEIEYIDAAIGKTSAVFWSKHKQTGLITQFARGKSLADYRAILEKSL